MLTCRFLVFILLGALKASLICGLMSVINFGKCLAIFTSNILYSLPSLFLVFLLFPLYISNSCNYFTFLGRAVPYFPIHFSIASCFQVFIDTFFKNIYFFFRRACSIVIAHQTHFFLSVKICLIHITSLDSFADSPSLPLNWPICSRMLSPFSIRTFNTLITDI